MPLVETLTSALGVPVAKFLLKKYLGEPSAGVGVAMLDIAKTKIADYGAQREALRRFDGLADHVVKRLTPLFEDVPPMAFNIEAVVFELGQTLDGHISADFFVSRDLDPVSLTQALDAGRPLQAARLSQDEEALYRRALAETVRYLIEVATSLPAFEPTLAAASLQRLSHIGQDIDDLLERVQRIERQVLDHGLDVQSTRYEADYRQALIRNLDYVELFGADIAPESKRHSLSVAYVSLSLETFTTRPGGMIRSLPAETLFDTLLPASGRLLVRGEAGSGKSTLLRWVAIQAALADWSRRDLGGFVRTDEPGHIGRASLYPLLGKAMRHVTSQPPVPRGAPVSTITAEQARRMLLTFTWLRKVPLLIRLRDCSRGRLHSPEDFPLSVAKELGPPPPRWVTSLLQAGQALVLIDGVDEVANLHRETLFRDVHALIETYPENYFVVSTRPAAVPETWLSELGFRDARVNPMSDQDRQQFIERWHEAVAKEIERQGRSGAGVIALAAELTQRLVENRAIARLAANPLLCAMICALHRERGQMLPESQSELCEALCQMLLHRRERESGLILTEFPEPYPSLSYEQKRALVQEVAHYLVRNGESVLTIDTAVTHVGEMLKHFPGRSATEAETVCRGIVERSGVLRETRPGLIDFIHNTIKEYLAADRFAEDGDAGFLATRALDPAWRPIVLFAVATRRRAFATHLMRKILEPTQATVSKDRRTDTRTRRLMVLQCRAMALHVDPDLEAELARIEKDLFPPRTMADAEVLASGGEAVLPFLRYKKKNGARAAAACVRALRLIGTRSAQDYLRGYARDRRLTVLSELSQAMDPLELDAVKALIKSGTSLPEGIAYQVASLSKLQDGDGLTELNLTGTRVVDLGPISGFGRLKTLRLGLTRIVDLGPIAALGSLEHLHIPRTRVKSIDSVTRLTGLRLLDLTSTNVSDLGPMSGLPKIQDLRLSSTPIKDLAPLSSLSQLTSLMLSHTGVSNLTPLSGLHELERLALAGTKISNVEALGDLTELRYLDLENCPVQHIGALSRLAKLEWLDLSNTPLEDLSAIRNLSSLRELRLVDSRVVEFQTLADLHALEALDVTDTKFRNLDVLAGLPSLRFLSIAGSEVDDLAPVLEFGNLQLIEASPNQVKGDQSSLVRDLRRKKMTLRIRPSGHHAWRHRAMQQAHLRRSLTSTIEIPWR